MSNAPAPGTTVGMSGSGFAMHPPDARLLAGRRALVSGATSGIGRAAAWELAAHGAAVGVGFRGDPGTAREMADVVVAAGGRAAPVGIDVAREQDVVRAFSEAAGALGPLDLVVCNAGVEARRPLLEMSLEDWHEVVETDLTGAFLCSREGARAMAARGARGAIVHVTSVHDRMPWSGFSHYCAAKAGQRLFVESIAKELAPLGIRVAAVAPGAIATPMNEEVLRDPGARAAVEGQIPMGRIGDPAEIARAVAWLASDAASYVTGATLVVDGGMTLFPPDAG